MSRLVPILLGAMASLTALVGLYAVVVGAALAGVSGAALCLIAAAAACLAIGMCISVRKRATLNDPPRR